MAATGHYITDADIDNWPSGATDGEQQAVIDYAEQVLEAALHTQYWNKPFDIKINGNDKNRLFLPLKANIVTVSKIEVWGIDLDPSWWSFDESSVFISPESGAADVELNYRLDEIEAEGIFPNGYNNIRIIGTYGAATVPAWIKEAAKILARHKNDPTLYTSYLAGSESIGNYSYSIAGGATGLDSYKTGIKEVDDLIRLFRKGKPIIMAP